MEKLLAPWTDEQVRLLNLYQKTDMFHPFTCRFRDTPAHRPDDVLRATRDGWVCKRCGYTQSWAWDAMASLQGLDDIGEA